MDCRTISLFCALWLSLTIVIFHVLNAGNFGAFSDLNFGSIVQLSEAKDSKDSVRNFDLLRKNEKMKQDLIRLKSQVAKLKSQQGDTNSATESNDSAEPPVYQLYIDFLNEAKRRSEKDFHSSHLLGKRGLVIGPTGGPLQQTLKALRNAQRLRNIQDHDQDVKLALITEQAHVDQLKFCENEKKWGEIKLNQNEKVEACYLWGNNTLFDDILISREPPPTNDENTNLQQGSSHYWMTALSGYLLAPYTTTIFIDSDAYPCPGFERLFAMTQPFRDKLWELSSTQVVDFAIGLEQYMNHCGENFLPREWKKDPLMEDYLVGRFACRNTGVVLFNFEREISHIFAHFIPIVSEHFYNKLGTPNHKVANDQDPFNFALYLFKQFNPNFIEQQFPMHASCRTYPGKPYSGIDGFRNGMLPVESDGKHCSECRCSPCLFAHFSVSYFLTINGLKGWENKTAIKGGGNSPEWHINFKKL